LLIGKSAPFKPYTVYTGITQGCAAGFYIRRHIFAYKRAPRYKGVLPNMYELMYRTNAAHTYIIAKYHMPCKLRTIAQGTVVAYYTIVSYMAVSQYPAPFAYYRFIAVGGTPVYGYKFSYGTVISNFNCGFFAVKFPVLRYGCNYSTGKNSAVFANAGTLHNGYIATHPGAFTNYHITMNYGKWVNLYIISQFGIGVYVCKWMNHIVLLRAAASLSLSRFFKTICKCNITFL
jgi:hypothetical protein